MNILVSGIAGDIGFGVGRILRDWGWSGRLFGIDIQAEHPGEFIFDQLAVAPRAITDSYIEWLKSYIEHHDIGLFIPASEAEIAVINKNGLREIAGAKILMANKSAINLSLDKYDCMSYLKARGLRVPDNGVVGDSVPLAYPVIVKPRSGQGSKEVQKIGDSLAFNDRALQGYIWQDYLFPDEQEYTCPVYHSNARGMRILVLRRTLTGGLTGRGVVVENPLIENYVEGIARALELEGAINVQLRLTPSGPCLFEVNPRLSSTIVFRDKMGFCDVRWWIQDTVGSEHTPPIQSYQAPTPGTRFFRGAQEYISTPTQ